MAPSTRKATRKSAPGASGSPPGAGFDQPFDHSQLTLEDVQAEQVGGRGREIVVGTLERITFANDENGFVIGRLLAEKQKELITVKGVLGNVREGETLKLWGVWEDHPTYGPQLAVESSLVMEPTTLEGIERYLEANIKGVGKKLARRIVKIFGHETFQVIDNEPEKLLEVPKFSRKVYREVLETWEEQKVKREVMVFLHAVGISPLFAERIFTTYGIGAVETLKDNPYRLAMDVQGIGFRSADLIAAKLGVARDSPRRAEAGAAYVMDEASGEGHTGLPHALAIARTSALLATRAEGAPGGPDAPDGAGEAGDAPPPEFQDGDPQALEQQAIDIQAIASEAIQTLLGDGTLKALPSGGKREGREEDGGAGAGAEEGAEEGKQLLFRNRYHRAEEGIVENLRRIETAPAFTRFDGSGEIVARMEKETGIYLNPEQRAAVEAALQHKVLVITGGPGTGKTTIIQFILGLTAAAIPTVALAAPTGKAANRLSEATGKPATTIHRLLEAGPKGFQRNADHPIEAELVIVDESSMIDTLLMAALLAALPDASRLVLVGDVDQLPSVGAGLVLGDLIASGRYFVARLEQVFRQAEGGQITANAHAIRKGNMPDFSRPEGERLSDFYFMAEEDPARIVDKIRTMLLERIPGAFGLDPRNDVQVLTPMHRGLTGTQNLNRMLQSWLNPHGKEIGWGDPPHRIGDRVMQTRNDYENMIFNGDMGEITGFDAGEGLVRIEFNGREVTFEKKHSEHLALGYAITVHKAQGSEYPAVVLPLTTHHAIMLQRNLLYTALTRGRNLVVVIGTRKAVGMAVRNARPIIRHTGLRIRLKEMEA